jgi:hypothetical protein
MFLSAHEKDSGYYHAVNDDGQTKQDPTGGGGHEELTGGADEREVLEAKYLDHTEYQDEQEEADYDEAEQYTDAQENSQAHEDEADAREESDQFVTNDGPEPLPDADPTYKGSIDPESTEYQEHEGHEEGEASGDAEATSTITVTTHAKEAGLPGDELRVLTEVRDSIITGESQFEEFEGTFLLSMLFAVLFIRALSQNDKFSSPNVQVPVVFMETNKRKPMNSQVCRIRVVPVLFHLTEFRRCRS